MLGAYRTAGRNEEPHSRQHGQEHYPKSSQTWSNGDLITIPTPTPCPSTTAQRVSPGPSAPTAPDLKGRPSASGEHSLVTCHALAAREAGKVGLGILSSCSAAWTLQLPGFIGRAFRGWRTKDKVKCPLQGARKAKAQLCKGTESMCLSWLGAMR